MSLLGTGGQLDREGALVDRFPEVLRDLLPQQVVGDAYSDGGDFLLLALHLDVVPQILP